MTLAAIRETPLSIDEVYQAVCSDAQGGVVLFVGRVRNHNQGNDIAKLEYEAYVSMAEKEVLRIIEEIRAEVPGTLLACTHRIGELSVGDLAVVCVRRAPHIERRPSRRAGCSSTESRNVSPSGSGSTDPTGRIGSIFSPGRDCFRVRRSRAQYARFARRLTCGAAGASVTSMAGLRTRVPRPT